MPSKMYNRARMTVTSTGTGALSLGVAVAGYQTFSSSGAQNNDTVSYTIEDGVNWEVGTGTFNSVAGTLSRTVTQSYNGTSYGTTAISVTTNAQVYITALAADIVVNGGALGTPSSGTLTNATGLPISNGVSGLGTGVATALGNATNGASGLAVLNGSGFLSVAQGGTGLGSLTTGYIPFGGSTTYGYDSSLFWDNTNKRLGIGTASPSSALHVVGGEFRLDSASGAVGRWYYNGTNVGTIYVTSDTMLMGAEGSRSFVFNTNGSEKLRLTADGNLGLGVTPSAWGGGKAFEVGGSGSGLWWYGSTSLYNTMNCRFDGTGWKYGATGQASLYLQSAGQHIWNTAASGTAGNAISFTQAMTLDASGNLAVGTASNLGGTRVHIQQNADANYSTTFTTATTKAQLVLRDSSAVGTYSTPFSTLLFGAGDSGAGWATITGLRESSQSSAITFGTASASGNPVERARIDANGTFRVKGAGTAGSTDAVQFSGSAPQSSLLLDASGQLGIGGTPVSGGGLTLNSSSNYFGIEFQVGGTLYSKIIQESTGTIYWDCNTHHFRKMDGSYKATIDSSGNLLVGTTSGVGKISSYGDITAKTALVLKNTSATTGGSYIEYRNSSDALAGYVYQSGSTAVTYTNTSDYRLKENIRPISNALADVCSLKPVWFDWKADKSSSRGFIAHEVQEVFSEAVAGTKDQVDENGSIKPQGVDYGRITPLLTAAIQELAAKVSALEARQ